MYASASGGPQALAARAGPRGDLVFKTICTRGGPEKEPGDSDDTLRKTQDTIAMTFGVCACASVHVRICEFFGTILAELSQMLAATPQTIAMPSGPSSLS